MYSPAERPSSSRAAPAKNRIWSTAGGISSSRVSCTGLPVLRDSAATSSSARCSNASAMRSRARCRSAGVVSRQVSNAAAAAAIARSTSSGPDSGAVPYASPVDGSIRSIVRPSAPGDSAPATTLPISTLDSVVIAVIPPRPGLP